MALGPLMLACLLGAGSAALTEVRVMSFNIRTASEWARTHGGDRANGRTWDQRTKGVVSAIAIWSHRVRVKPAVSTTL